MRLYSSIVYSSKESDVRDDIVMKVLYVFEGRGKHSFQSADLNRGQIGEARISDPHPPFQADILPYLYRAENRPSLPFPLTTFGPS
jgi:hypothetical protein